MSRSDSTWHGRLTRLLRVVRREPSGARPPIDVRIKLQSLPAPLRAVARAQADDGLLIEAELPWLTVGSEVDAELPDGTQKGRVRWFGVDVTRAGSARLRVFVDLKTPGSASAGSLPAPDVLSVVDHLSSPPVRRAWPWLVFAVACVAGAFVSGLMVPRPVRPALLPSLVDQVPPRTRHALVVPKQLPELVPEEETRQMAPITNKARPKHRRK